MSRQRAGATTSPRKPSQAPPPVGSRSFNRRAQKAGRKGHPRRLSPQTRRAGPAIRETLRRVPRAAWICALVACLNAACWSLVTPPFQVPDEPSHVAYVMQLAETGSLPKSGSLSSPVEKAATQGLRQTEVAEAPQTPTISTEAQQQQLERNLSAAEDSGEKGSEDAGVAAAEPPLYYALEAIPYSFGESLLDSVTLMRLLSALMGGLTALFAFLFIREALPRAPWAWSVGGLCVALVPLFGFMSGAVNPDAMLFAVSAAAFYLLARGFNRGLTHRCALALGAVVAIGLMTKLNFAGLLPGLLLGLVLLSVRSAQSRGARAYRSLAAASAIALSPVILYALIHLSSGRPLLGIASSGLSDTSHGSLSKDLSYIWQLYLPRLPGMHNDFLGIAPWRQIWFDGYVGLYGWLDTTFPGWVYEVALALAGVIVVLCGRGILLSRAPLRPRAGELLVYVLVAVGLMALVGGDSYLQYPGVDSAYGQTRYLLPLLPLLGAVIALAARGGGRRWGPVVGVLLILLFLAHDIFSQLQVVARFYG